MFCDRAFTATSKAWEETILIWARIGFPICCLHSSMPKLRRWTSEFESTHFWHRYIVVIFMVFKDWSVCFRLAERMLIESHWFACLVFIIFCEIFQGLTLIDRFDPFRPLGFNDLYWGNDSLPEDGCIPSCKRGTQEPRYYQTSDNLAYYIACHWHGTPEAGHI